MTPRVHVVADDAPHAAGSQDEPGYRRAAETYFPSNGALLLAVGLMVAGGQSVHELNPGFPAERAVDRAQRGDSAAAVMTITMSVVFVGFVDFTKKLSASSSTRPHTCAQIA